MSSRVPSSASPPREAGPPTQYLRLLLGLLAGGIAGNVLTLVYHWSLSSALLVGLLVAYLPTWFDGAQYKVTAREGSRYWPWFAKLSIWRSICTYFPASLTTEYDFATAARNGGQFVFAMHPHGMLSVDHALFFTDAVGFMSKVFPTHRRDLGASVIFQIPFFRDFVLWLGVVDAGASTAHRVLSNGYSMQLYPGGIQEQLATDSSQPKIVARGRYGFVKLALAYDVPIVPVYVFGEDKLYTSVSFLIKARRWLVKALRVGVPFYYGRLDSFGLLPESQPLECVVGEPLWPRGINPDTQRDVWTQRIAANTPEARRLEKAAGSKKKVAGASPVAPAPTAGGFVGGRRTRREVAPEEVQELHDRYVAAMTALFDKHKHKHPAYAKATLEVLSA